jgi:RNA polymerase sigma factor (sigma-70 family)
MQVSADILRDAHNGDRKAQYLLYKQCFPVLMSVCSRYRYGEQDAVAAVNQGFLKIIQNLDRMPEGANFEAWIRRIQINLMIDEYRRNKKYKETMVHPEDFEVTAAIYHNSAPVHNEGAKQLEAGYLERLLQKLPPVTRQVFNLFAVDGYSHAEIGEMLGISDGTSKWHVNSARVQLKTWLENAYGTH